MSERIDAIKAMLRESPGDVFLLYSLGMEEVSRGCLDLASKAFAECITADADYLPAWIERGRVLRSGGNLDEARAVFEGALELAGRKGDAHASDMIRGQLEALGR
jgi:tetratricopeptide (TPR) repeat protein